VRNGDRNMSVSLLKTPFDVRYRELWLPPSINGNATLPTSVEGGHGLTLTGARKGTTVDGVHFTGSATSNINCGAIHNAAAKLWLSFRFKPDQDFSAASPADIYLWAKFNGAADLHLVRLESANGRLYWQHEGVGSFSLSTAGITTWNAGQWYHVLVSLSNTAGARFIVDGGTPLTSANADAAPAGGDVIIGDRTDGGAIGGLVTIADVVIGTDDLTAAEETDLYNGIPPADAVNSWMLDEGRGVTAVDRGSGGNNGTLDTAATWAFGQVEQPVLSLDGINDHGQSSAGVNISGDLTLVWVGKMKSTYNLTAGNKRFVDIEVDGNNLLVLFYQFTLDEI
ncbi:hypothetical protein LCGC14_3135880, partial [marine sediment metagenome]